MKGPASAASVVITVLTTLLVSAVAYGASAGLLHRTGEIHPMPPASQASPKPEATPPPPPVELPTPRPTPGGMYALDADMADGSTGWILLTDCDIQPSTCRYAVAGTKDAGRTWTRPVQVGPSFASSNGDAPRTVRFVTRLDGFVYGDREAYVTHDGGQSWRNLDVPAVFFYSVASSAGLTWLTTYPCPKGTFCPLEVRASTDGGRSWSAAHKLPLGFSPELPVAFPGGVVMSSVPNGDVEMTSNKGLTWRSIKSACSGNPFRGFATTADGVELWEECAGYPDSSGVLSDTSLFVSEDGGKTWTRRNAPPVAASPVAESLVTTRHLVAFAAGQGRSVVTRDGGNTWSDISDQTSFTTIRLTNAWGWALDIQRVVWQTYDGGDDWAVVGTLPDRLG